jgi:hypothetical protein
VFERVGPAGYHSGVFSALVPERFRYDPKSNPHGARPTIWDVSRNIYGTESSTGSALRVFDNVGVQYGLGALHAGAISQDQFLDLNQSIGGYDRDNHPVLARTEADPSALVEAYRSGLQLSGSGGLAAVPIMGVFIVLGGPTSQIHSRASSVHPKSRRHNASVPSCQSVSRSRRCCGSI